MGEERVIVAAVQMTPVFKAILENLEKVAVLAEGAVRQGAQLVVFPECALTGYCFESREEAMEVAEPTDGATVQRLMVLCRDFRFWLIVGTLERDGDRLYNAALFLGPDGLIRCYRKVHLPHLGVDRFVNPGDRPFSVDETPIGRIGVHICYDAAFPEVPRILALEGAEILCLPTNWAEGARPIAECIPRARAIENHLFFVVANRVGKEGGFRFIGQSQIVDPSGEVLARAGDEETTVFAEICPAQARQKRVVFIPGRYEVDRLGDRRPGFYRRLTSP